MKIKWSKSRAKKRREIHMRGKMNICGHWLTRTDILLGNII